VRGPDNASPKAATAIEAELLTIWREILNTPVELDDNFFDLGGTSLQLIAVHARIAAAMKTDITVVDLFQYPRIASLALRLTRGAADAAPPTPAAAGVGTMNADERARRQQAALARARSNPRRNVR
jgi:hypothetical protein